MLSIEDNQRLTRTGRGTQMGELYRRFWFPALLSSELPEAGGPPVKVRLLGERLIAVRTAGGQVGLLEERCPHRHASLYWGRTEDDGLRCVYHGWKFGTDGQCLDMPAEPESSTFKARVRAVAYATHEAGGIIWAYMGPADKKPPFPELEWTLLPEGWYHASKRLQRCNWFQNVEGELDTAHVQFLHRNLDLSHSRPGLEKIFQSNPEYTIAQTPAGLLACAARPVGDEKYWRITPFLMPSFTLVPAGPHDRQTFTAAVPVDDENMWGFTVTWRHDRPFNAEDWDNALSGESLHVEVDPKTFIPVANRENDFLMDRERQRTLNFTGILGIRNQDLPVQEDQDGPLCQRDTEHLGTTDRAIVAARRQLLRTAKALADGTEPSQPAAAAAYRSRSLALQAPAEQPWEQLFAAIQPENAPAATGGEVRT